MTLGRRPAQEAPGLSQQSGQIGSLSLRVVFPLRGAGQPLRRKCQKNGEKLQDSPPRSGPRNWAEVARLMFSEHFFYFWGVSKWSWRANIHDELPTLCGCSGPCFSVFSEDAQVPPRFALAFFKVCASQYLRF